jgi:thiol-disulfide isomerase/thioredoxin
VARGKDVAGDVARRDDAGDVVRPEVDAGDGASSVGEAERPDSRRPLRGDDRHTDPWVARSYAGNSPSQPLPTDLEWLNTEYPLSLEQLRGKIVLIDFWTYGCINCIHNIPELIDLQERYRATLVIIGVHSAKFDNEGRTENLRRIISRYNIPYPVINDAERRMMDEWNVKAWPTLVLIDPAGNVAGRETGEGFYQKFNRAILGLIREFEERGDLDRSPVGHTVGTEGLPQTVLSFPSKVVADANGRRLFVADTNNHRILEVDAASGAVNRVIGAGTPGFEDGSLTDATFRKPRGMALDSRGATLYVADTGNHAVRTVDLTGGNISTLAGTGIRPYNYPPHPGPLPTRGLRSPWDLALRNHLLYIAMAGSHQIWQIDMAGSIADYAAGTGREEVVDGPAFSSRLAQPSGLTILDDHLYFADSESSFLRRLSLPAPAGAAPGDARIPFEGVVETVAGSGNGLFDFGDRDGVGREVKMQHPLGLAADDRYVYIADTYNHKIKRYDPRTRAVTTIAGGEAGWADGGAARFFEPGGLDLHGQTLYVADTNNHAIRKLNLQTGVTETLVVHSVPRSPREVPTAQVPPARLPGGTGTLTVDIELPEGFKVNEAAPSGVTLTTLPRFLTVPEREIRAPGQTFPVRFEIAATPGSGSARARISLVYCREGEEGICFFETVDLVIPIEVVEAGAKGAATSEREAAGGAEGAAESGNGTETARNAAPRGESGASGLITVTHRVVHREP